MAAVEGISAKMGMIIAFVVAAAAWTSVGAQPPAGCTTALTSLMPCLGYVTGNTSTPSADCCTRLGNVVTNQVACLCAVINGTAAARVGFPINQTQAITLPGACNVQTPPMSQCNAAVAGAPVPAPSESPSTSPTSETTPTTPSDVTPSQSSKPAVPSPPSGSGTKTVPNKGVVPSPSAATNPALLSVPLFVVMIISAVVF